MTANVMGSTLVPNRVIAEDVKRCTYCYYVRCKALRVWVGRMTWPKTGATQYHAQLGHPDIGHAIKGLVVCYDRDLKPLDLLNGLVLGCYQPSPEVWIVTTKYLNSISIQHYRLSVIDYRSYLTSLSQE